MARQVKRPLSTVAVECALRAIELGALIAIRNPRLSLIQARAFALEPIELGANSASLETKFLPGQKWLGFSLLSQVGDIERRTIPLC